MEISISTLVYDSRKVENDSVFVCISGAVCDGHDFAGEVVEKGAAALIVEKDVTVPSEVTVIRVPDTRVALAEMSAAYFGHPALKRVCSVPLRPLLERKTFRLIIQHRSLMLCRRLFVKWWMQDVNVSLWRCLPRG